MDGNQYPPNQTPPGQTPPPAQPVYTASTAPVGQLNASRSLGKYVIYSILTLGIYGIVFHTGISNDLNVIASRYDGRRTMHYCLLAFIIAPLTLGIGVFVWYHNLSQRVANELARRYISYDFSAGTFWLWYVLGSLMIVGPFIYIHKLAEATNLLADDYNRRG